MSEIHDVIGANAIAALVLVAVSLSLITAFLWVLVQRYGLSMWHVTSRLWTAIAGSPLGKWGRRIPLVSASFTYTMTAWRYLGIHAVLSFIVALATVMGFFELADEIGVDEELGVFDQRLALSLSEHVDLPTLELFATITHLGDRNLLLILGALVGAYFLLRRWWLHVVTWALATGVGGILVRLLKAHFERTRPIHEHTLTDSTGWSFPSGHASGAVLLYGMLSYFIIRHTPRRWHIPIALTTILLVVFVGFSRVILQVHYFSDVLAGFSIAAAWLALCITAFEVVRRRTRQEHLASSQNGS
jgi:membrane-associated phospholipid phosphatase